MDYKYWVRHGASDSFFAAKDKEEAESIASTFNRLSIEYGSEPNSTVEIDNDCDFHKEEMARRETEGDEFYFMP